MSPEKQKDFVASIFDGAKKDLQEKIDSGAVPESWDGHEIREWAADFVKYRYNMGTLTGKRKREYEDTVLEKNLI